MKDLIQSSKEVLLNEINFLNKEEQTTFYAKLHDNEDLSNFLDTYRKEIKVLKRKGLTIWIEIIKPIKSVKQTVKDMNLDLDEVYGTSPLKPFDPNKISIRR